MDSVVAILSRYEENAKWISRHYEKLKREYRDEWVAVLNGGVVDSDHELSKLVERLRRKYPENYNEIAAEYVTSKEIELIL
jgi:ribosomal protein L20